MLSGRRSTIAACRQPPAERGSSGRQATRIRDRLYSFVVPGPAPRDARLCTDRVHHGPRYQSGTRPTWRTLFQLPTVLELPGRPPTSSPRSSGSSATLFVCIQAACPARPGVHFARYGSEIGCNVASKLDLRDWPTPGRIREFAMHDCTCRHCLCYKGTRDGTRVCRSCRTGQHPGDPRPAGRLPVTAHRP
jgi:hypothetical protein